MATITGSSGIVKAVTSGGSVANVGEVRSYSLAGSADTIEDTAMGDSSRTYKAGLKSHTASIECYFDSTDSAQEDLIAGAVVDFEIHPEGTGVGTPVYSASGVVDSSEFNATFDGMVEATFSITVSGDVTIGAN